MEPSSKTTKNVINDYKNMRRWFQIACSCVSFILIIYKKVFGTATVDEACNNGNNVNFYTASVILKQKKIILNVPFGHCCHLGETFFI